MASCRIGLLMLLSLSGYAQTVNRYFVSFKDKVSTPYSVSSPTQFLSSKSIARRVRENFSVNQDDLPVDPAYVAQVKATGASVFFSSRWFNGVLVQMDATLVPTVASLAFVERVQLVAYGKKLINGRKAGIESSTAVSGLSNQYQLLQVGLDVMHSEGFLGEGIDVAVMDAGYIGVNTTAPFQHLFSEGRIKDTKNFVKNTSDVYTDFDHGTEVLSVMAAFQPGTYEGGAYKANYFLYETEDAYSEYRVEEYNWAFAAERADSAGVEVINTSLGYNTFDDSSMDYSYSDMDGKISVIARAAKKAVERGILVAVAEGNEGNNSWRYLTTPADAAGVFACGSVGIDGSKSIFSSIGPSADGRIKPDVSGLGSASSVVGSNGSIVSGSGTSFSSPLIASLLVGLRQVFPSLTVGEIYTLVINSASQISSPDNYLGYGVPHFEKAKNLGLMNKPWAVYPNPVDEEIRIFFSKADTQDVYIQFMSPAGQEITSLKTSVNLTSNPVILQLSSALPAGLYFLKVSANGLSYTEKIVKK